LSTAVSSGDKGCLPAPGAAMAYTSAAGVAQAQTAGTPWLLATSATPASTILGDLQYVYTMFCINNGVCCSTNLCNSANLIITNIVINKLTLTLTMSLKHYV